MRLEQLNERSLTPEQREVFDAIAGNRSAGWPRTLVNEHDDLQGPFNAMVLAPDIGDPLQQLGAVLRFRGRLPARVRELVILTVARDWESEFEWHAHARIGRDAGLTDSEIHAVFVGARLALDDPVEQAALEVSRALVGVRDVDDDLYALAEQALGSTGLIELTTLVAYYALLALQMRVFRVPLPAGVDPVFDAR